MPILPRSTTRTRCTITLSNSTLYVLTANLDHMSRPGGCFGSECRLKRSCRVFWAADCGGYPRQRAIGEIGQFFAQRATAHAVEHRPTGGVSVPQHDVQGCGWQQLGHSRHSAFGATGRRDCLIVQSGIQYPRARIGQSSTTSSFSTTIYRLCRLTVGSQCGVSNSIILPSGGAVFWMSIAPCSSPLN